MDLLRQETTLINRNVAFIAIGAVLGILVLIIPTSKMLLFLSVGGITAIVIFLKPEIGLLLIVGTLPLEMLGLLDDPKAVIPLTIPKILGLLTGLSWLVHILLKKTKLIFPSKIAVMILFFASVMVSDIHAWIYYPDMILEQTKELLQLATIIGLCFLIVNIVRPEKLLTNIVDVWIVAGTFIAAYAIGQRFLVKAVEYSVLIPRSNRGLTPFVDTSDPRVGEMVRTMGVSTDPSWCALPAVMMLPLILYKVWTAKSLSGKCFFGALILIQVGAIVCSFSRIGFLTLLLVFLVLMIKRRISMPVLILILLALLISVPFLPNNYVDRVTNIQSYKDSGTVLFRIDIQKGGLQIFKNYWLMGIGLGNFDKYIILYSDKASEQGEDAHYGALNMYLQVVTETGVIGLTILLLLLWLIWRSQRRSQRFYKRAGNYKMFSLCQAFELSLIAFLFFGLFAHHHLRKEWWLIAALTVVAERLSQSDSSSANAEGPWLENTGASNYQTSK